MKNIKDELRDIIISDGSIGQASKLKKTQNFLRRNEETGFRIEKQKYFKNKEEISLLAFAEQENLFYQG